MKLQQLQVFVAVARERSLRAASRQLNLTQPAVTRTIQELESDLGVALFTRSVKGVVLTVHGAALEPRANRLLEDVRRAREELDQLQGDMRGTIACGATSSIALTLLPRAVQRFREKAPCAQLSFMELKFPQAAHRLRDGQVDFVAAHVLPDALDGDLRSMALLSTDFVVMARQGHPLASARTLAALADAEWLQPIATDAEAATVMTTAFRHQGLTPPRRIVRYGAFAMALGLVAETDMLCLFSRPLAARVAKLGLQPIELDDPMPAIELRVAMRKDLRPTPLTAHFLMCLQASAHQLASESAAPFQKRDSLLGRSGI